MSETRELRDVRIGSTGHFTQSASDTEPGAATLCGKRIAGTPVAPAETESCSECWGLMGCDECGHGTGTTDSHLWAPAMPTPELERFIYDNATCWAEHICRGCSPELYAQAMAQLEAAGLTATNGMAH